MSPCDPATFTPPTVPGSQVASINAAPVTNYTREVTPVYYPNHDGLSVRNATFCNVTVGYARTGEEYLVTAEVWLPSDNWNGRLQAAGGSGLGPGRFDISYGDMAGAVGEGYATVSTDAGIADPLDPYSWVLEESPGKINNVLVGHWGGDTLNDMAIIAKSVIQDFYGRPAEYSYFNGCSNGGRQGFEMAQSHPTAYDGIAAAAPAIHWAQWAPAMYWPQMLMNTLGEYPRGCELDWLTSLAVRECDGDDGVEDLLLSNPAACTFDPFPHVGRDFLCVAENRSMKLSRAAATIANASWAGPTDSDGNFIWYGANRGSDLSGQVTGTGIAAITCSDSTCRGNPVPLAYQWIQLFVEQDPNYDYAAMTREGFDEMMKKSGAELDSMVANSNPNLTDFYNSGGKMMTYHGLYDQIIPVQATEQYYDDVGKFVPNTQDFYRMYEVPGLAHCFGNGQPKTVFDALRAWVENGTVPESLPTTVTDGYGKTSNRILCPYPQRAMLREGCGDAADAACFICVGDL